MGKVGQLVGWGLGKVAVPDWILFYCTALRFCSVGDEVSMNATDGGNRSTWRNTCPSATLSTANPTWIGLGMNPGLRHGTALNRIILKDEQQLPASVVLR